jgi:hypothetical protein
LAHRLQGTLGNAATAALFAPWLAPGEKLSPEIRAEMEARFGQDFGDVRVHVGGGAAESAAAMGAAAYTIGHDVVFGAGRYDPGSAAGANLLAHELAHVVQQKRGGAPPVALEGVLEAGAEQAATAVMRGNGPVRVRGASGVGVARQRAEFQPGVVRSKEINRVMRALENLRVRGSRARFHEFMGQNEILVYEVLNRFGYRGSWVNADDTVRDFDKAYRNWQDAGAETGQAVRLPLPPQEEDPAAATLRMWQAAASDPIAAAWIIASVVVSDTIGRALGFTVDPDRAGAIGSGVSLAVQAAGAGKKGGANPAVGPAPFRGVIPGGKPSTVPETQVVTPATTVPPEPKPPIPEIHGDLFKTATWSGSPGATARFKINQTGEQTEVTVYRLERGEQPKGTGGTMLASALQAAGAARPTTIILDDVVNPPTLEDLRQGKDFSQTVLGRTFASAVSDLGGRITETKVFAHRVGSGRRDRRVQYDVVLKVAY